MRLSHVIEAVYWKPWFINQHAHAAIRAVIERKLGAVKTQEDPKLIQPQGLSVDEMFDKPMEREVVGSVARIPIVGTLARGASKIEKAYCGLRDYKEIAEDLAWARDNASVSGVLLHMDTPGGMVNGCHECYEEIVQTSKVKPTYAFTEGQICSAGYYLGSACDQIIATPSSFIGSIGVLLQVLDNSKYYEAVGLKMHTLRSGELKAPGVDGDVVTDEQLQNLQSLVDGLAAEFKGVVSGHRPLIDEGSMQGQVFRASEAKDRGLIDLIVNNEREAMALLK